MITEVEITDEIEKFIEIRAKAISEKLAKLSDEELEKYQKLTSKKEKRIAKRLGLIVSDIDDENIDSSWRFLSLKPEEQNAFEFVHIRWYAHLLEWMRRQPHSYSYSGYDGYY
jgi:hypothetical protein